jgi:hypothetical protein
MKLARSIRFLLLGAAVCAAAAAASAADTRAGAALLFAKDTGGLTESQQQEIFAALGLRLADDRKGFVDDSCGQPADAQVRFEDLNGDRTNEVIADFGNTCMSGMAGTTVALFVKDATSHYRVNLGFPGMIDQKLASKSQGWPDLRIGGPGFCFPIWRWNGKEYAFLRNEPQQPGGCDGVGK